jgi:Domain of unknown function (DUF4178)
MSGAPPHDPLNPRPGGFGRARPVDQRNGPIAEPSQSPNADMPGPWEQAAAAPPPPSSPDPDTARWDVAPADGWAGGGNGAPATPVPAAQPGPAPADFAAVASALGAGITGESAPSAAPVSGTKAVSCPNCGGTVEMHAAGYTVSVACQYCGSILDVTTPEVALIERNNRAAANLAFPLGSRGMIRGTEYQLVGQMVRSIDGEAWEEYLLFNPYVGYRWLVCEEGEWSIGTMLVRLPDTRQMPLVRYGGVTFEHDGDTWDAQVDSVVGEFYWRVERGERAQLMNFESEGATLSREAVADEVNWTIAQPIVDRDIVGFGQNDGYVPGDAPPMPGMASPRASYRNDVSDDDYGLDGADAIASAGPFARAWTYTKLGGLAALFMLLVIIMFSFSGTATQTFSYAIPLDGGDRTVTFGPVTFPGSTQRVSIQSSAPGIDNAWIDADIRLVERTRQDSIEAYDVIERYSGSDSDGAWTEGSDAASTGLASVPAGTYDIIIDASAHSWPGGSGGFTSSLDAGKSTGVFGDTSGASSRSGQMITVTTSVSSGGTFFSNFILALFLLAIPPLFLLWRGFSGRRR